MHKFSPDTSIFSPEAWAVYQALLITIQFQFPKILIISDSRSVLDSIISHQIVQPNYLIPLIKAKLGKAGNLNLDISFIWIPSYKGIWGNTVADCVAKRAVSEDDKLYFKVPFQDFLNHAKSTLTHRVDNYLRETAQRHHVLQTLSLFLRQTLVLQKLAKRGNRDNKSNQIQHYNLNYSLFRKNLVDFPACDCEDPRQDINQLIFVCPLTRLKAKHLFHYLRKNFSTHAWDIFPLLSYPPPKLIRLLLSFLKSCNLTS